MSVLSYKQEYLNKLNDFWNNTTSYLNVHRISVSTESDYNRERQKIESPEYNLVIIEYNNKLHFYMKFSPNQISPIHCEFNHPNGDIIFYVTGTVPSTTTMYNPFSSETNKPTGENATNIINFKDALIKYPAN
jgi:hypothetical protein